jgi:hypothetical protein
MSLSLKSLVKGENMYLYFVKKFKGDQGPSLVFNLISDYLRDFGKDDVIFMNPGYFSQNVKNINKFCKNFNGILNNNLIISTVGMNGKSLATPKHKKNNRTVIFEHLKNNFVHGVFPLLTDHSKIVFFLDGHELIGKFDEGSLPIKMPNFPMVIKVKAMLIGSSNLSYNTYFSNQADKGETDVLILNDIDFPENIKLDDNYIINEKNKALEKYHKDFGNEKGTKDEASEYSNIIAMKNLDETNENALNNPNYLTGDDNFKKTFKDAVIRAFKKKYGLK